ncbi:MAG: serine hydrolase, partial [Asticcacaulis sp.]
AQLLKSVFLGVALTPGSIERLKTWMMANQTGARQIRAGVPSTWIVADKTGHGANGAVNDVAVVWPKDNAGNVKPPVFLAIYTSGGNLDDDGRYGVIADITRLVFDTLAFAEGLGSVSAST